LTSFNNITAGNYLFNLIYSIDSIHLFFEDWTEVAARTGGPQVERQVISFGPGRHFSFVPYIRIDRNLLLILHMSMIYL
jgi:hypothetical protein